jgi:DNA ligase-1
MRLPKLFKRSVNGKTLEWEVEVKDNCFRTISGYTDGVKTLSEWTCCEAKNVGKKNATNPAEQASAEALAMWTKRKEAGSFENISDIDSPVHFKPMLAHDYNDYKDKITFPVYSQPKLDGVRCIIKTNGMWSRNGKPIISAPHIFEALKPLFEQNPDLILDGELFVNGEVADFNTIISCVRKTKPTKADLETSKKIQYWIYDLPSHSGTFTQRYTALVEMNLPDCCERVRTDVCGGKDIVNDWYEDYIEWGYEGQIIRLDGLYENKRSKSLLKHKSFVDGEFEILGVEEGKGNLTGKVGRLNFKINDKTFDAAVNGDWEYIERLWHSRDGLIGKMATVKYFELTTDGVPRFPKVICIRDFE